MKLAHNGIDDWHGTFGLTAKAMIQDILSDGDPFDARLTWNGKTYQGSVLEITKRDQITIDLTNGETEYLALDDLETIEVL